MHLQGQQQGGYQGQQQQQQPREFSSEPPTNLQQRVQRDQQRRQSNGPADGFVVNEEIRCAPYVAARSLLSFPPRLAPASGIGQASRLTRARFSPRQLLAGLDAAPSTT